MRRLIAGVLALPTGLYAGVCGLMMGAEPWLVYPAPRVERSQLLAEAEELGAEVLHLESADGTELMAWRTGTVDQPLVLHLSGNGSRVGGSVARYRTFSELGYGVLHLSYRGYPGSEGEPHEQGLIEDALAAWRLARQTHAAGDIVVHGHSLGGGVGVALVSHLAQELGEQPRALVTEASFSRAWAVGAEQYPFLPVRWLMRNSWESVERGPSVATPTLILHGADDGYIPPEHGEALASAIPGARLHLVAGGQHNTNLLAADPAATEAFLAVAGPARLNAAAP